MSLLALLVAAALAGEVPDRCPSGFGEQHRYVACYEAMLAGAEASGDLKLQARALMELAWAAWQKTELEKCRERFERAAEASHKAGDLLSEARAISFLGLFLQTQLGDYDGGDASYQKALEIATSIKDRQLEGEVLYHRMWLRALRGDVQGALAYGERSLEARRAAGDRRGEGLTLSMIGMVYRGQENFEECIRYQKLALPLIQESGDRRSEADILDRIGHALTDLNRFDEAIPYHKRAIELRQQVVDRFDATLSFSNLALAYRAAGRFTEAAETMQHVIDEVERARENQSSRDYKTAVLARKLQYYERYIDLLMAMHEREPGRGHSAKALHVSERARARMTLDAIDQARADGGAVKSALEEARPLTAAEIRDQLLDDETMLLEFALGQERSFVWGMTPQELFSKTLAKRETIEIAARRLHELLSAGDQRTRRRALAEAIDETSRLALAEVTVPKSVRRIVIVADGALQYIPFSVLHLKGSQQALLERYEVVTVPSASTVVAMRKLSETRQPRSTIAVLADPVFSASDDRVKRNAIRPVSLQDNGDFARLPFTRREAEAVLRLAPPGSIRALDFDARRDVLLSGDLARFGVIHLATHAIVDGDRAGIVLSLVDTQGRKVDGFVSLQDLFRMRLESSLVVLSACRTALGRDLRGEGVVSLVRGFMHAGVPRVVATYWDVKDESTSELMRRFYRAMLVEHLSPGAALRTAQLAMLRQNQWRAPHFWAAFTLQGDWR